MKNENRALTEELLDYTLEALPPARHAEIESLLKRDPAARRQLHRLRQALEPLAADRRHDEPPPDLVMRTLAHVAEYCCREVPRAPHATAPAGPATRPFWRRADVLVAAAVLLMALGLGIPWISYLRQQAAVTECQANLKKFYDSLKAYSLLHGNRFPNVAQVAPAPRNVAGMVVPMLRDAQILPHDASVRCPANGGPVLVTWSVQELQQMDQEQFDQLKSKLIQCYAYSLGYRGDGEVVRSLEYDPQSKPLDSLPLMADGPPRGSLAGNSPNHGKKGQNVLFADGHVSFCTTRTVGIDRDDIFTNFDRKIAPGLNWKDAVLAASEARP